LIQKGVTQACMNSSTILVTGATGFVGSHCLHALKQQNFHSIRAAVRCYPDNPDPQINFVVVGSIGPFTDWRSALEGVDIVVHLAARAHILDDTVSDPEAEFQQVNMQGTLRLVEQSIQVGVKQFLLISSVGAMASSCLDLLTEESICCPDTPYGRSKLRAEEALIKLASIAGMTWTIIRPPLVYGPGNPGNMERLIQLVIKGIPIPLGNVRNRRSLIYVGNLVDAIILCLSHPHAVNQLFLVSDGQDVSTPELIEAIAFAIGRSPILLPMPMSLLRAVSRVLRKQDLLEKLTGSLALDIQKIRRVINWTPPYTFAEGIQQTLQSGISRDWGRGNDSPSQHENTNSQRSG
jgi:nucleoside-diphosphate-sugar epimerase